MEFVFFFFSSRRRHTRFKCDWSSDVCSSDLPPVSRHTSGRRESCYLLRSAAEGHSCGLRRGGDLRTNPQRRHKFPSPSLFESVCAALRGPAWNNQRRCAGGPQTTAGSRREFAKTPAGSEETSWLTGGVSRDNIRWSE